MYCPRLFSIPLAQSQFRSSEHDSQKPGSPVSVIETGRSFDVIAPLIPDLRDDLDKTNKPHKASREEAANKMWNDYYGGITNCLRNDLKVVRFDKILDTVYEIPNNNTISKIEIAEEKANGKFKISRSETSSNLGSLV